MRPHLKPIPRPSPWAFAALLLSAAPAFASSTTFKASGADATASFTVQQTKACGTSTAAIQTFVSVQSFETALRVKGTLTTSVQTTVAVSQFDFCTGDFLFDFGFFGGAPLSLNALNSAALGGHFVLPQGTIVDVNLTITGTSSTSQGISMRRTSLGNALVIDRTIGSTRSGSVSGTVTINGATFGTAQMLEQDAMLARHTGGEVTVIKP